MSSAKNPSPRREELLELAYGYVLEHGLTELSLRPLATAIGSSPRVLLFLFETKDKLVRALLRRAREEERALLKEVRSANAGGLQDVAVEIWRWLAAPEHQGLLVLWTESYARSLTSPGGTWAGFGAATVNDWLDLLADVQSSELRDSRAGETQRTLVLATLRGALLDLLATGDRERTTAAVHFALSRID
jgi:AcrR family transcriptional regulator